MKLRLFALLLLTPLSLLAQKRYAKALASIDAKAEAYTDVAQQIWSWAELGYQEEKVVPCYKVPLKKQASP